MNRRGFLAALIGGATLDPERLLWRPGAKLISVPAMRVIRDEPWIDAAGVFHWQQEFVFFAELISRTEFQRRYPLACGTRGV